MKELDILACGPPDMIKYIQNLVEDRAIAKYFDKMV
jgi:hypothetical protein